MWPGNMLPAFLLSSTPIKKKWFPHGITPRETTVFIPQLNIDERKLKWTEITNPFLLGNSRFSYDRNKNEVSCYDSLSFALLTLQIIDCIYESS